MQHGKNSSNENDNVETQKGSGTKFAINQSIPCDELFLFMPISTPYKGTINEFIIL